MVSKFAQKRFDKASGIIDVMKTYTRRHVLMEGQTDVKSEIVI